MDSSWTMVLQFKMIRPLLLIFIGAICFVIVSGEDGNFNCQVFYKPSLIAIVDKSAKMGLILDYSSRLILAINGRRSSLIVMDISEQVRYYLENEADTVNSIWANFNTYFRKLSSLKPLLATGKEEGEKSKLSNLKNPSVNEVLDEIFNSLGGSSLITEEPSLLTKFMEQLRGPLSSMYRGNGSFKIFMEVIAFAKVNLAMAELLNYSKEKLTPENVNLDATVIFRARSAAEVLLKLLRQVGMSFDLTKVFDGLLSKPGKLQRLLMNAISGSHDGLDGLFRILADYVGVFTGKSSIIRLISSVLSFNSPPRPSLSVFVKRILTEVESQDKRFHNADGFSIYVTILKGMLTYDYTDRNISLSDIITLLPTKTKGSSNPLLVLVEQLSSLYPASTIPHFYGSIMKQFNPTLSSKSTPEKSNAQVFFTRPFMAFINEPDRMAVIIDYSSRLMVLFNGKQSSIIVIDISEQVLYHLENKAGTIHSFWSNFRGYIQKLSSLQSFLKTGKEQGKKYELKTLQGPVLGELVEVSKSMGASLPIPEELSLHTELIEQLSGPLDVVYTEEVIFRIFSGGDAFMKVNLAMAKMLTDSNGKFDRQVFYKPSLIAIIDKSAKMGMILDYSSRLILAINGRHSSLIVVDISEQVRYFLKNDDDTENKIWSNFKEYFDELSSLKPLLKSGKEKGEKSKLSNLKDPSVNKLLDEIFNSLGGSSLVTKERSLLIKFMEQLRGPLSLIYRGNGCFRIFIEVIEFTKVNLAVAELLNYSKEKLSPEDVHLDATAIFKAQSGAEVLLKVMCQIGIHFDLTKLFDGLLSSPEKVQSLLINASSGSHDGLDGLIRILANYVGVFTGKSSIIRLSSSILGFRSRPGPSLSGFVEQILTEVKNQDKRFHNAPRFSMYVSILEGMITYDYTDHNISLSDIITRLPTKTGRSSNRLLTLVEQLSSLYPASTIPHFFGSIMKKFNWTVASESTPEKSNAQVFFTHPFIAFINEPVRMAVIIDYSSRLMVLFNGKQSSMIVMDISEQVLYHLENEADTENSFWSNFRGYIQKLSSLQSFLKTGQEKGKKFELKTLAGPVLGELVEVSKSLGASLPIAEELSLHTKLIEQLRGVLAFVFRGDGGFRIDSGGDVFIKVSLAMAAMLTGSKE